MPHSPYTSGYTAPPNPHRQKSLPSVRESGPHPHLIRRFLGPPDPSSQAATRSNQSFFLQNTRSLRPRLTCIIDDRKHVEEGSVWTRRPRGYATAAPESNEIFREETFISHSAASTDTRTTGVARHGFWERIEDRRLLQLLALYIVYRIRTRRVPF